MFSYKILKCIQAVAQSDSLECQSTPNPSQICDWQSKSTFQIGLTIKIHSQSNNF